MENKIKVNMVINDKGNLTSMFLYPDGNVLFKRSKRSVEKTKELIEREFKDAEKAQFLLDLEKCIQGVDYTKEELLKMDVTVQSLLLEYNLMLEELANKIFTSSGYSTESISRSAINKIKESKEKPFAEKILTNKVVSELIDELSVFSSANLVGGAIVDIIDGREPKDYDLIVEESEIKIIEKLTFNPNFKFLYNSPSSTTFLFKGEHEVQFIKSKPEDFYFLNERNSFNLRAKKFETLFISLFETKMLAVNSEAMMNQRFTASQFGIRVRHWERKGYRISDTSYDSAIRKADRKPNTSKNS